MNYNPYWVAVKYFPMQSKMKRKYKIINHYSESYTWYKVMIKIGGKQK